MSSNLLQTKLHIPLTRSDLVHRPRLIERLNEGLGQNQGFGRKLTLISASAGFGKTTLIADWGSQIADFASIQSAIQSPKSEIKLAWLSLDEGDNDLNHFLAYLVAALQTIAANLGAAVTDTVHRVTENAMAGMSILIGMLAGMAVIIAIVGGIALSGALSINILE